MNSPNRFVPTLSNRNFGSSVAASEESVSAMIGRLAAEGEQNRRNDAISRIGRLAHRYEAARAAIVHLAPGERIEKFGELPAVEQSSEQLQVIEAKRMALVEKLELRAEELERLRLASQTELEKLQGTVADLTAMVSALSARVAILEGRGGPAAPRSAASVPSRADVSPMLVPSNGAPGLGGVSAAFAAAPAADRHGVRRLGSG